VESLGLAFRDRSTHLVYVKKGWGGIVCDGVLDIQLPTEVGQKLDQRTVQLIDQFLLNHKVKTREVYAVVRPDDVLYKTVTLPRTASDNLMQVLEYEFENYFPFPLDNAMFDFAVLNHSRQDKGDLQVFISVIKPERYYQYHETVSSAGLTLTSLEPHIAARACLFQWLQTNDLAPTPLMTLDANPRAVETDLYASDHWEWRGALPGPNQYETVKQTMFRFEAQSREKEKRDRGEGELPLLCLGRSRLADSFVDEIREYFPLLDQREIFAEVGMATSDTGSLYAFSAAMGGVERRKVNLNFVPIGERKRQRRGAFYMFVFLIVIAGLLGGALLITPYLHARSEYARLQKGIEALDPQVKNVEQTRAAVKKLQGRLDPFTNKEKRDLLLLLKELTQLIPEDSWLTQLDIEKDSIKVRGESENANALIAILENSPHIKEVAFSSPVVKRRGKDVFNIEMKVERSSE